VDEAADTTPRRPVLVSVAVVMLMVLAGFGVLEGVLVLLARYDDEVVAEGLVMAISLAGAAGILLSLLLGAIAAGVWRGSRAARIVVTVIAGFALLLDVVTIAGSPPELWWTAIDAAFYLFVVIAFWAGRRTAAYFRPRRRARAAAEAAS